MIKNLIFDVGSVLIGYRVMEMLTDYGLETEDAQRVAQEVFDNSRWTDFDSGRISMEELIASYKKDFPHDAEHIDYFLNHMELLNVDRPEVWEKVVELRKRGYRIYILSNYSEVLYNIHTRNMYIRDCCDGKVISYETGTVKPDPRIYNELLSRYDLNPAESVFFDDRQANTEAAKALGIKSYTISSREHINELLDKLLSDDESIQ